MMIVLLMVLVAKKTKEEDAGIMMTVRKYDHLGVLLFYGGHRNDSGNRPRKKTRYLANST